MPCLEEVCMQALRDARAALVSEQKGEDRVSVLGKSEIVTKGDLAVSKALKASLFKSGIPAVIYSEETGGKPMRASDAPEFDIYFDELDGTFNYHRGVFPYTTVISAFKHSERPIFSHAIFCAVMDHTSDRLWHAKANEGCFLNGKQVHTSGKKELGKDASVIIDYGPCSSSVAPFLEIYSSAWVRNVSSAGFHFAGVASGHFDAYALDKQKAHELSAGYLLIKEAGGALIDFEGNKLDTQGFDFNSTYKIIAAATPELAEKLRGLIRT